MERLLVLFALIVLVFGTLFIMSEINNAPDEKDEDDFAKPVK